MPETKKRLLDEIVAALKPIPNLQAIALGGSHARGTEGPQSDLDIGLYYREEAPFVVGTLEEVACRFSASGRPTVTDFHAWGPFVNGGAWIDNAVCKVDFLYRDLDALEACMREAQNGVWTPTASTSSRLSDIAA